MPMNLCDFICLTEGVVLLFALSARREIAGFVGDSHSPFLALGLFHVFMIGFLIGRYILVRSYSAQR